MILLSVIGLALYAGALIFAAASDLLRYQIPNWVVAAVLAGFVLYAIHLPFSTALLDLSAALTVLVLTAIGFAYGVMGGGDAKLMSATALWTGWGLLLPFLLLTSMGGALLALLLLALRRITATLPPDRWYSPVLARGAGIPYGLAIAFSGLVLLVPIGATALR
ncbi:MAG: A24 family peptidase [Stellaceae bacterium]